MGIFYFKIVDKVFKVQGDAPNLFHFATIDEHLKSQVNRCERNHVKNTVSRKNADVKVISNSIIITVIDIYLHFFYVKKNVPKKKSRLHLIQKMLMKAV